LHSGDGHYHPGGENHEHDHGHDHGHSHGKEDKDGHSHDDKGKKGKDKGKGFALDAAALHVMGDLVSSIGVVIASVIIKLKPEWKIADPIITFVFGGIVIFSTYNVMKSGLIVLMQGVPPNFNIR